jgi:protoheme IX farnesyltransferase
MILTSVLTLAAAVVPTLLGATGYLYLVGAGLLGGWLVVESIRFRTNADAGAARRVLLTSYAVLMGLVLLMFLDKQ